MSAPRTGLAGARFVCARRFLLCAPPLSVRIFLGSHLSIFGREKTARRSIPPRVRAAARPVRTSFCAHFFLGGGMKRIFSLQASTRALFTFFLFFRFFPLFSFSLSLFPRRRGRKEKTFFLPLFFFFSFPPFIPPPFSSRRPARSPPPPRNRTASPHPFALRPSSPPPPPPPRKSTFSEVALLGPARPRLGGDNATIWTNLPQSGQIRHNLPAAAASRRGNLLICGFQVLYNYHVLNVIYMRMRIYIIYIICM